MFKRKRKKGSPSKYSSSIDYRNEVVIFEISLRYRRRWQQCSNDAELSSENLLIDYLKNMKEYKRLIDKGYKIWHIHYGTKDRKMGIFLITAGHESMTMQTIEFTRTYQVTLKKPTRLEYKALPNQCCDDVSETYQVTLKKPLKSQ